MGADVISPAAEVFAGMALAVMGGVYLYLLGSTLEETSLMRRVRSKPMHRLTSRILLIAGVLIFIQGLVRLAI